MSSREKILAAVKQNQPELSALPELHFPNTEEEDLVRKFLAVAVAVGSSVFEVNDITEIKHHLAHRFPNAVRIVSTLPEFDDVAEKLSPEQDPHSLENVDVSIIKAHFAVAENSASWVTETLLSHRVLPFVNQHLALIVDKKSIVPTMHHAYELIGSETYGFGVFIAGPSKTADIEQSLVLGAHGPRTLTIFLL